MCLVEIEGLPKLDLACSTVVREGMKVWTSTPKVLQARQEVLGFLLADHPLDCPICDKAGECFLQDLLRPARPLREPVPRDQGKEKKEGPDREEASSWTASAASSAPAASDSCAG